MAKSKKALTQKEAEALGEQHVNRREFADGLGPVIAGRDEAVSRAMKAEAQLSSMLVLTKSIKRERDEAIKINGTLVAEKGELLRQLAELKSQNDLEKATLAVNNKLLEAQLRREQQEYREVKALLHGLYDKIEGRST